MPGATANSLKCFPIAPGLARFFKFILQLRFLGEET